MVQRAAAWDDAVAGPDRLIAINAMAMQFYGNRSTPPGPGPTSTSGSRAGRTHPDSPPGYAPDGWTTLVHHLGGRGVTDDELLDRRRSPTRARTGRPIDRFRDRVVLPITHDRPDPRLRRPPPPRPDRRTTSTPGRSTSTPPTPPCSTRAPSSTAPTRPSTTVRPGPRRRPPRRPRRHPRRQPRYVGVAPLGTALTDEQARQLGHPKHLTDRRAPTPTRPDGPPPNATSGSWPNTEPNRVQPNCPRR